MDPITVIMGLAQFVPALVRWAKGDKAGDIADQAVAIAQTVTGTTDPAAAIEKLKVDPQLALQFQQQANQLAIAELEAETKQLESINATMRAEAASGDKYVARWRPTFGYAVTVTWAVQMLGFTALLGYAIVARPTDAAGIIAGVVSVISALSLIWGVALSVLGISVSKRSQDKQISAGLTPPPGLVGALAQRLGGGISERP